MLKQKIAKLLKSGETYNIEFKECKRDINKDVYETVCAPETSHKARDYCMFRSMNRG